MKRTLLIALLLTGWSACGQSPGQSANGADSSAVRTNSIGGIVLDSLSRQPVEFATVALVGPADGSVLAGDVTDGAGRFSFSSLTPGRYRLRISFVGYADRTTGTDLVIGTGTTVSLPPLLLRSNSQTLNEVTVKARRDLIEDREDRVVYHAGDDPTNAGGTAIDVMKRVPLLTVDPDGSIQLKGSSSIKVLINNKPSSIMARSVAEALQMIPAEAIRSVEVITAPSAKYDAEGTAGIINIVTKSKLQGLVGGVTGTTGNRTQSLGANLNLKQGKIGLTAYGAGNMNRTDGGAASVRRSVVADPSVSELRQNSINQNVSGSVFGSFNLDYDLDSLNQFGLDGSLSVGSRTGSSVRDTRYEGGLPRRQPFRRYSDNTGTSGNYDVNLNYTRLFKRPDQELEVLTQLNSSDNDSRYALNQFVLPENAFINYREQNTNRSRTTESTVQTDYTHPFKRGKKTLEAGVKSIRRNVESDYRLQNATDSTGFRDDPRRANQFGYQQWVVATYASFRISTPKKWTYTLGGRYEHTSIQASFVSSKTSFSAQYAILLPSVSVSKRLKNNQRLRLSYNQRIQRPGIQFLNPYINSSDPKNLSFGNPYLNPERAHAVEFTYSIFTKKGLSVNTTLFGRLTNNAIERVTTVDTASVSSSTYQNIARNATYGLNLFGAGRPAKNWRVNGTVGLNYNILNSAGLNILNRNWTYQFSLNSNLSLPNDYSVQGQGAYQSARLLLQGQSGGFYSYGVSVRKEFKPRKLVLTLNAENFLTRYNTIVNQSRVAAYITDASSYNAFRNVRLTANWRFGNLNAKTARPKKRISNDDGKAGD